ncbi:hypothetical protein ACA910_006849 [Epithemia clementina (nom. ined.)]
MKEVKYEQIATVLEAWDAARFGSKDFDNEFGMVALERLFELQPRAKKVFGYDQGDDIGKSHATVHAIAFAGLFDSIFQMLGHRIWNSLKIFSGKWDVDTSPWELVHPSFRTWDKLWCMRWRNIWASH